MCPFEILLQITNSLKIKVRIQAGETMNARTMTYYLIAAIACGLLYTGWKLTSRNAYESAEYTVLESMGEIELREYPDLMMASTQMGSGTRGGDGSFGRLFQYISGGNEGKQKVAMTTPVFMEPESGESDGQMGFVIPKGVAKSSIPEPANSRVHVTKRLGGKFAVIRFAGRADLETRNEQQEILKSWIEAEGHIIIGEAEVASYDPPWTPGPFRRNEILIRIQS